MNINATLCWSCTKAVGKCSWSAYEAREPVKGWDAIPTKIKCDALHMMQSYHVISCPEYEKDPPRQIFEADEPRRRRRYA